MRWLGAAAAILAVCLSACAPTAPTPTASAAATPPPSEAAPAARYPVACIGLAAPDCDLVRGAVEDRLAPDIAIVAMMVGWFSCPAGMERCPETLAVRRQGTPLVESVDGRLFHVPVAVVGGALRVEEPDETPSARLRPESGRAGAGEIAFSLEHCGLASPVDADGSLWDPVGRVDGSHPAAINAADGRLRFTGPASAEFRTPDGFVVSLLRRLGAKSYELCS